MNNRLHRMMSLAEKVSKLSNHASHKHGAVIARNGRIIAFGANSTKTHPKARNYYSKQIHSEFQAILNARMDNFNGCDIYVFRRNKERVIAKSRPCSNCLKLIRSLGFKRIYFSDYGGYVCEKVI